MKRLKKLANFTLHDQQKYVEVWKGFGYDLDPTPRAPLIQFEKGTWTEEMILNAVMDSMRKILDEGFEAIIIGGLSNCMAYAWYVANMFGLEVVMARTPRVRDEVTGKPIFVMTGVSKLLTASEVATRVLKIIDTRLRLRSATRPWRSNQD